MINQYIPWPVIVSHIKRSPSVNEQSMNEYDIPDIVEHIAMLIYNVRNL